MPAYTISAARPTDLPFLPAIEIAAARLLTGHAPESVLAEATSREDFERAMQEGHLLVALADDVPVGFAQLKVLEPEVLHLDEIDVHPDHGRRGVGTRLVMAVYAMAAANGYESVTLSTFRGVKWNMPFYAKMGFEVVAPAELSPALCAIVADEVRRGLDSEQRVVMRRRLITSHS